MQIFSKIFELLNPFSFKAPIYNHGPNTLDELLKQFDAPKKEKTNEDIIRDYTVKEAMANLEVEMLRMEPAKCFRGSQIWYNNDGKKFYDWVPCVLRPEVIYCSYGKN